MQVENEEEVSLRDTIASAMQSEPAEEVAPVEAPAEPAPEVEAAPAGETAEQKAERQRDEAGRFAKQPKPKTERATAKQAAPAAAPKPLEVAPAPVAAQPTPAAKAPQSWTPAAREKWGALPPEVQREVAKREGEVARTLNESAEERKLAQGFRAAVAPFEAMILSERSNPIAAVQDLLQTAHALRTAPPAHKAKLVATMMQTFGIPVEALAAELDGKAAPRQQMQMDPNAIAAQTREAVMRDIAQQREAALVQRNAHEVEAFGGQQEFFPDVRQTMGDILLDRAQRGIPMSLEEAYKYACQMHPEVSGVLRQREAAQQANAAQASTQRARAAASSVRSQPAGPVSLSTEPKDLRSAIAAAVAANSGR